MPPKIKVAKENIVSASVEIVRERGGGELNARALAKKLGCSTQPIFSNFPTMADLKKEVVCYAENIYQDFVDTEIKNGTSPEYKSYGRAYIAFAKEEKELFKLLFMTGGGDEPMLKQYNAVIDLLQKQVGESKAEKFHFEMWMFVHGIASLLATGFLELDGNTVSEIMTDAYRGLLMRHGIGE